MGIAGEKAEEIREEVKEAVQTAAVKVTSGMKEGSEQRIAASEEILSYAGRLREIGDALLTTIQEVEDFKRLVGKSEVYAGEAQEDMYFYYNRLNEIICKITGYYYLGDSIARDMYVSLMDLDAYIAGLYTLAKED